MSTNTLPRNTTVTAKCWHCQGTGLGRFLDGDFVEMPDGNFVALCPTCHGSTLPERVS